MALIRKMRLSGNSIVITIPSQLLEAYDIKTGDMVEITPLTDSEIKLKRVKQQHQSGGTM